MPHARTILRAAAVTALAASALVWAAPAGASVDAQVAPAPADGSTTDQIIVTFSQPGQRLGQQAITADAGNGARSFRSFGTRSQIVKLPNRLGGAQLEAVMQRIAKRPNVELVEADQIMQLVADDALYGEQWDLTSPATGAVGIDVEGAWATTTGSADIRVAVIDTGIVAHADLAGRYVRGYDFISDVQIANDGNGRDNDPSDPGDWILDSETRGRSYFRGCTPSDSSWHGTHVAGTIGAATNNIGIAGINQVSQIVPIRVLGKCGGYTTDIVDGMRWAAGLSVSGMNNIPEPAQVLSLSLGGSGACSATYQNAIDEIVAAGAVVVVAAGNSDANAANYSPASCDGVVTVAATGKAGDRSYYSNYGNTVEIAAPGGDRLADDGDTILSTLNSGATSPVPGGDIYVKYQGTSMATPHVSGVVSLMLSAQPGLTPAQVTQILQSSATSFPSNSSCSNICGAGILNAAGAVAAAAGTNPGTTTTVATTTTTQPAGLPGEFVKLTPDNGATGLRGKITFSWQPADNATGYEVCLDAAPNGDCDGTWQAVSGTGAQASGLAKGATYEWQVRAVNGSGSTEADGGTSWTFTTR